MSLIDELLGYPLLEITRSYWAVKLDTGEWVSEARVKTDLYKGEERHFDWSNDLVANGDVARIKELWLLCPPSKTSPLGNTARLVITEPNTAFQFKVATADSNFAATSRTVQAHIIGKITNKETGACECFIWDSVQEGLITPDTKIFDASEPDFVKKNKYGFPILAGKTNVYNFHSWRDGIAPLGRLELNTIGAKI
jgi:hypothetical protein